ncbi:MAG: alpha-glucosidase [Gammaproteobacteria bacterium]|nr:alpha-glucosidase [Gammaproteobacteria bacterium]
MERGLKETGTEWWRGAVIYQIYPRSFQDSNNDGIGDLQGIRSRLDYIADLGVDGVWISPFFTSPMKDFGYDVADYQAVDPIFGTLKDFDALLAAAHRRNLKIIIDQVYSHTSDQHAWFAQSRANRSNDKADWYVWADPKPDGSPPNNWQSVFTGPAWTWDARREQYYLHTFLPEQPDLNLHHPAVQQALLDVARFWLKRGVDGFRLDAINHGMHDPELRDNPVAEPPLFNRSRPYLMQYHLHSMNHPDMLALLERIRGLTDTFGDIFTLAEVGSGRALPIQKAYTADAKRLNSAYGFEFLGRTEPTAANIRRVLGNWSGASGEGWPSWAFSNHDAPRVASRWLQQLDASHRTKLLALLLIALRGNALIYQGEELGLPQAEIPFDRIQDPEAKNNWPQTLGRDGARTPMPWQHHETGAGFSQAEPWLPMPEAHRRLAVDGQLADPESTLHFFRRAIGLRNSSAALRRGALQFLDAGELLAFVRQSGGQLALCVFNLTAEPAQWTPPQATVERRLGVGCAVPEGRCPTLLPPFSGFVGTVEDCGLPSPSPGTG